MSGDVASKAVVPVDGPVVDAISTEAREGHEAYNLVVKEADLQAVQLLNLSFNVDPAFFGDRSKRKLDVNIEHGTNEFDAAKGAAFSFVNVVVSVKRARKNTLLCKAEYVVVYENLKGCETNAVKAFLDRVAPFACYPYFRSVFATLDWAAGTMLPPLPIHKEKSRVEKAGAPF
ncbi:MAG: hypothetical protein ACO1OG_02310 [Devosia sp.]